MEPKRNPNDPARAQLGELVRSRRRQAGLTQEALTELLKGGRSTVHRIENRDKSLPKPETYARALSQLGITEEEMVRVVEETPLRVEVQRALRPVNQVAGVLAHLGQERATRARPDLVVITADGDALQIQVKGSADGGVDLIAQALKDAGLIVSIPA